MTDRIARTVSILALVVALAGSYGSAGADPQQVRLDALQEQVDVLRSDVDGMREIAGAESQDPFSCFALSSRHYVKERFRNRGRKWRMPLVVWNTSIPECRP